MGDVTGQILRRIIGASTGPETRESLLASVGLAAGAADPTAAGEFVAADVYYDLLERCTAHGTPGSPSGTANRSGPSTSGRWGWP